MYTPLLSCALIVLGLTDLQACPCEDVPREVVLDWLKNRILEGLGLDEPPVAKLQSPPGERVDRAAQHGAPRVSREARVEWRQHQDTSQVILFPTAG